MSYSLKKNLQVHPMIIFWLGLLTGAIIVSLIFFYRTMNSADYESALLRTGIRSYTVPQTNTVSPLVNTKSFTGTSSILPDPTGGYTALPDPTGG